MFSPTNPHKLYFASNVVWQTVNGGHSWTAISGDLSREKWDVPANVGVYTGSKPATATRRGVVYALAPSPVDSNTIWAGTDDGLIWVTRNNGKSWSNVTPPQLVPWAKVSIIDASHFDANEAYAAVNTIRLNEQKPHIYRTKDGGRNWTEIVTGMADDASTNVVREDTKRRGLLFAGTEAQVWYSLDDGDHWAGLRLNMPAQIHSRSDHQGQRSRHCVARTRLLDPGRHLAAAAVDHSAGDDALQAGDRHARALLHVHRHADAAGRAERRESAGRRDHRLLSGRRREGRGHARHREQRRPHGAALFVERQIPCPGRRRQLALVLVPPALAARHVGRTQPLRVGPEIRPAAAQGFLPSDLGDPAEHSARSAGTVGAAGGLHRSAHRGRPQVFAVIHRANGSAREDAGGGDQAAV